MFKLSKLYNTLKQSKHLNIFNTNNTIFKAQYNSQIQFFNFITKESTTVTKESLNTKKTTNSSKTINTIKTTNTTNTLKTKETTKKEPTTQDNPPQDNNFQTIQDALKCDLKLLNRKNDTTCKIIYQLGQEAIKTNQIIDKKILTKLLDYDFFKTNSLITGINYFGTLASLNLGNHQIFTDFQKFFSAKYNQAVSQTAKNDISRFDSSINEKMYFTFRTMSEIGYLHPNNLNILLNFFNTYPKAVANIPDFDHCYLLVLNYFMQRQFEWPSNNLLNESILKSLKICDDFVITTIESIKANLLMSSNFRLYRALSYLIFDDISNNTFDLKSYKNLNTFVEVIKPKFEEYLKFIHKKEDKGLNDNKETQLLASYEKKLRVMNLTYEKNKVIGTQFVDFFVKPNICCILPRQHELLFKNEIINVKPRYRMSRAELELQSYVVNDKIITKEEEMIHEIQRVVSTSNKDTISV